MSTEHRGFSAPVSADTGKAVSSTVVKALHVLQALGEINRLRPEGASVSEIAKRSGEHASSVCKHLAAFQQFGMVDQDEATDRYRIGTYPLQLASIVMNRIDLREIAAPFLRRLVEQTGETVHLVIRDGIRVVYIDKVESPRAIRMHSQVGWANPLYCTGVGKAILAHSPESLLDRALAEPPVRFTDTTLTERQPLADDLTAVRRRGYAIDNGEHAADVRCAAAPIFNHLGEPVAAVSVAGPEWRLNGTALQEAGEFVRAAAADISIRLGAPDGARRDG